MTLKMKTNPGGQIPSEEIVGRDELIDSLWVILEGRSIYMNDLRRIGKTQIMVKMDADPREGWRTVKRDIGGIHRPDEFAAEVLRQSLAVLGGKAKLLRRTTDLLGKAAGVEIGGLVKLPDGSPAPWKEVLGRAMADVDEVMLSGKAGARWVVFLWDEVPFMLDNIAKAEGTQVAMELLDTLRALGQNHDRVRFLLTGSIGLHHVLKTLKKDGYHGSPLNRMELVQPGPLEPQHSVPLAYGLLAGDGVRCGELQRCAEELAVAVGHVPFYIHKLISRLSRSEEHTPESIRAVLEREIMSDHNDWDLQHYRDRLKRYYGENERLALHVLDAAAAVEEIDFQSVRRQVNAREAIDDERLRDLLGLLAQDHYLVRTADNGYRFYLDLIRRWWRLSRNL